ncbi:hypothetical protein T492DRAFT_1058337 [Pavlovales sp. CCMP2436]|nr:hypothetical protein T492DRAFT_1058337 [Pavlovales sp. CCMP2436]
MGRTALLRHAPRPVLHAYRALTRSGAGAWASTQTLHAYRAVARSGAGAWAGAQTMVSELLRHAPESMLAAYHAVARTINERPLIAGMFIGVLMTLVVLGVVSALRNQGRRPSINYANELSSLAGVALSVERSAKAAKDEIFLKAIKRGASALENELRNGGRRKRRS